MMTMQIYSRGLREICRLLGYTPQAYYQYNKGLIKRALKEDLLIQQVIHPRRYQPRLGVRKLQVMMQPFMTEHHMHIGRDVFFELLRGNGLLVRRRRQGRPRTTFSSHRLKIYPDLLKGITVKRPEEVWVSDITYINLSKGFAYLSLVTDVYSRKIVGYYLNDELTTAGPLQALEMAVNTRKSKEPL